MTRNCTSLSINVNGMSSRRCFGLFPNIGLILWVLFLGMAAPKVAQATVENAPMSFEQNGASEHLASPVSEVPDGEPEQLYGEPNWRMTLVRPAERVRQFPQVFFSNTGMNCIFFLERPPQRI